MELSVCSKWLDEKPAKHFQVTLKAIWSIPRMQGFQVTGFHPWSRSPKPLTGEEGAFRARWSAIATAHVTLLRAHIMRKNVRDDKLSNPRATQRTGMQPFSNSFELLTISCSHNNFTMISQTVQELSIWQSSTPTSGVAEPLIARGVCHIRPRLSSLDMLESLFNLIVYIFSCPICTARIKLRCRKTSVCPPVCHTPVGLSKRLNVSSFSPADSHAISVSVPNFTTIFRRGSPYHGRQCRVWKNRDFSTKMSLYPGNGTKLGHSYYRTPQESRIWPIE